MKGMKGMKFPRLQAWNRRAVADVRSNLVPTNSVYAAFLMLATVHVFLAGCPEFVALIKLRWAATSVAPWYRRYKIKRSLEPGVGMRKDVHTLVNLGLQTLATIKS